MDSIRAKNIKPERIARSLAHALGLGFRFHLHRRDLPGRPDIVLPRLRVALFVHGCFWHRHRCRFGCVEPATRPEFWRAKFAANIARDRRNMRALRLAGWRVIAVWECQTRDGDKLASRLRRLIGESRRM